MIDPLYLKMNESWIFVGETWSVGPRSHGKIMEAGNYTVYNKTKLDMSMLILTK